MSSSPYTPQFYDHRTAMQPVVSALSADKFASRTAKRDRKRSETSPEEYLLLWDRRMTTEEKNARKLHEMYVTMHRRYRGVTISDQFGYFGTRPETQGVWIDYDPDEDGEVHPINIVRPDIRANTAALLQMNVGIDVEPANLSAIHKQNADRIQKLADFFERDTWTEADRNLIFDGVQKDGTWLIESYRDYDRGCDQKILVPRTSQAYLATFDCPQCGLGGTKQLEASNPLVKETGAMMPCPECQTESEVSIEPIENHELAEKMHRTGEIAHRFWDGFSFTIDRLGAKKRGIETARWLRTMELVERAEIEDLYPHLEFSAPFEWCYSLKASHALSNADWTILSSSWMPSSDSNAWDIFQRNKLYLHESAYRNYVSPADWEFVNAKGRRVFRIKRGETWAEAVKQSMGEDCSGFCVVTINEQVVDILHPERDETDFRECFSDVHFQRDSGSYLSVPHWDSRQLQDDVTLFNTIAVEAAARNSYNPVWFNSEIFDVNDFGREYVPSKDAATDPETDITKAAWRVPVAESSEAVNNHLQFLLAIRREVSGVQPAMLGESQPDQPYAAQRQQLEQAFGLLTTASKSFAQMKVRSTRQKIKIAFRTWTLEQFQGVAARFGETWNEEDVEQLVRTDLSRDVVIDYVPGSETPQGNLTKELKFYNALREALPYLQTAMQIGVISPALIKQILKRIDEFGDFDFDLSGDEATDELSQKRYQQLAEACAGYEAFRQEDVDRMKQTPVSFQPVMDPATGEPAIDPGSGEAAMEPITEFDLVLEDVFASVDMYFSRVEDGMTQSAFFVPEIIREMAKPKPNYVLISAMEQLVDNFSAIAAQAQNEAAQADPERQAADREAESQKEQEAAKAEAESQKVKEQHERDLEKMAVQEASKENDREFERERMANELLMQEAQSAGEPAK